MLGPLQPTQGLTPEPSVSWNRTNQCLPTKAVFWAVMLGWDVAAVGIGLFAKSFSNAQGLQRETKPF